MSTTATMRETRGAVDRAGSTDDCRAAGGTSSCGVLISYPEGAWGSGPGDSGAAAYRYNGDGTITLVGNDKGTGRARSSR